MPTCYLNCRLTEGSLCNKVKEAGRDFTYLIVVLVGIGVTGGLFYVIFKELFSSSSPSKIYGDALKKCRSHPEVGFRTHCRSISQVCTRNLTSNQKEHRLGFYIEGSEPGKQGTVHVEVKENPERGRFDVRYIFVDVDSYPRRTIVIEDNR
uniref:Mitochondrial import inner membrane translocase subunit Tim21 n=1 Tax=Pavo cristatus TaxID=9049 RepID=A0A8C9FLW3_PAVCR